MFQWLNIFPLYKEFEKQLFKICLKYYCLFSESNWLEKGGKDFLFTALSTRTIER